jgi:hypothetical protein
MAAGDLYAACVALLAVAEDAAASTPGGPIGRVFVSPGPPAWDCPPQLTVHAGGPVIGDTLPLSPNLQPFHRVGGPAAFVNLVALTITVIRCVPAMGEGLSFPAPAEIEAAAVETLADVWAIWNYIINRKRQGALFADDKGNPRSRELVLDPAVPLNIQGGAAGWQIQVRVELPGYDVP